MVGGSLQNDDDKRTCGELLLLLFLLAARTNAKKQIRNPQNSYNYRLPLSIFEF